MTNAILNSRNKSTKESLDTPVYDTDQCFDSMWLHEVITSLFLAGLKNDKLQLLYLESRNANIAVKTPVGLSSRTNISNIIMQGSVWRSLCRVVVIDKLVKLVYNNPDMLYCYKGVVPCPLSKCWMTSMLSKNAQLAPCIRTQ